MSLEKAESVAKIISLIALPLVVAVGGWFIQSSMNENAVKSQYVEIAVNVLSQDPEESNVTLRDWASRTLAEHSSIEFSQREIEALVTGEIRVSDYKISNISNDLNQQQKLILNARQEIKKVKTDWLDLSVEERARIRAKYDDEINSIQTNMEEIIKRRDALEQE